MNNNLFQLTIPDTDWKETTTYTFEGPNDSGVQHNLVLVILNDVPKKVEHVQVKQHSTGILE